MNSQERDVVISLRLALTNFVLTCATCRGDGRGTDGKACQACGRARAALTASDQLLRVAPDPNAAAESAPLLSSALRRRRALAARERYP